MVNGRPTRAVLNFMNNEDEDISVLVALGAILTPMDVPGAPDPPQTMRNLTGSKFGTTVPAKSRESFTYSFATVMHPQDVTLELKAMVSKGQNLYTLQVFKEGVSIVEAPVSIFDPQMYVSSSCNSS